MEISRARRDEAPLSELEAAFGRRLDRWLSYYRLGVAGAGLVLVLLVFRGPDWSFYAGILYFLLATLVLPFLRMAKTPGRQRLVRILILIVDICTVSVFTYAWGTRTSPAVFLYVVVVVGWTLVPQLGLGRLALVCVLTSLAGLLLLDDSSLAPPRACLDAIATHAQLGSLPQAVMLPGPSDRLLFFGLVASALVAVHNLLNFTVARLREHSLAVSRLLAEKRDRAREAEWAQQLEEAARLEALGRLAGGVAHDFNNLLTALIGCAELAELRLTKDPAAALAALRSIHQAAERGAGLTAQLLDFARRRPALPQDIDLSRSVASTAQLLRRLLKDSISLELELSQEPCGLRLDPSGLERLLFNLAVNGADAMPDGGKLTVRVGRRDEPGQPRVVLEIQDQGTGIADEDLPHIFEPFFTRKARGKGTGLGLASVYGIVKQSQGEIQVESKPGQGACFRIHWPRIALEDAGFDALGAPPVSGEGTTILLVDDDDGVREVSSEHLRSAGYRVLKAASGAEALRYFEGPSPRIHLLLSDVSMPGMSGLELARAARERIKDLPVLLMSGYAEELQSGALLDAPLLAKPFSRERILAEVEHVLARAHGQQERARNESA